MVQTNNKPTKITREQLKKLISESVKRKLAEKMQKPLIKENYGYDETPEEVMRQIDAIVSRGREFAFDIEDMVDENGDPYGWLQLGYDPKKNILYGGGATNAGVMHDFEMEYDLSTSLDRNLEAFYEMIQQELLNNGYNWA